MSHHPDESGAVLPDDRLLVRPYIAPSGRPSPSTAPAWPRSGPAITRLAPAPDPAPGPARGPGSAPVAAASPDGAARRGRRLTVVVSVLLGLGAAGGLALLLTGPEESRPERAVAPPGLSVPVLPARSPGAGAEPSPGPSTPPPGSPRPSVAASASASARPGSAPGVSTSPTAPASGSAPAGTPSAGIGAAGIGAAGGGTLRPGDRGSEVRALQERLHGQGFTYVVVNGVYDGRTRRGVAQLQSDRGISGDPQGVYGPATRAAFG
ncbi:peptidoglycan-binding domain-containing protein [Streptomyces sp. MJM1172]|uniref:peptidoglycan-binding domain-containing protein n=1 Tax=Streptomyces sp. MJM1172 TaxID=1703926 RepID=UPI00093D1C33|nr:peptidoglycan-binding domain-containing protein [Streptomyces sp. MJM1172]